MTGSSEDDVMSESEPLPEASALPGMPEPGVPTSDELATAQREARIGTVRSTLSPGVRDAIATAIPIYLELGEPDSVEAFGAWIAGLPW